MPARIRTLKPEIWEDEKLGRCSIGARLLFIGLITQADDEGRFKAAPTTLRARVFPHDDPLEHANGQLPGIGAGGLDVDGWLDELAAAGIVRLYEVRGERFGDLPGWLKHQRIQRPSPSTIPPRPRAKTSARAGVSRTPPRVRTEPSRTDLDLDLGSGSGSTPLSSRSSTWQTIWTAYTAHHPTTKPTDKRRRLLTARQREGYDQDTLLAAIEGNHLDPWCNGENPGGRPYHAFELIFRDAEHVEKYAAIAHQARNGHTPSREEMDALLVRAAEKGL